MESLGLSINEELCLYATLGKNPEMMTLFNAVYTPSGKVYKEKMRENLDRFIAVFRDPNKEKISAEDVIQRLLGLNLIINETGEDGLELLVGTNKGKSLYQYSMNAPALSAEQVNQIPELL